MDKGKEKEDEMFWLESVVMVKENNQWKIQMLHSSRARAERIPKDVIFEEYIPKV